MRVIGWPTPDDPRPKRVVVINGSWGAPIVLRPKAPKRLTAWNRFSRLFIDIFK